MSIQSDFVAKYKSYADTAAKGIGGGVTSADVLSQWAQETGWGQQINGQNNLGGIKPGGTLANYETLNDFVSHYVYVMKQDLGTGSTFLDKLSNGVYEGYNDPTANQTYAQDVAKNILMLQNIPAVPTSTPKTGFFQSVKNWIAHSLGTDAVKQSTDAKGNNILQFIDPTTGTPKTNAQVFGKPLVDATQATSDVLSAIPQALNTLAVIVTGMLLAVLGLWLITKAQKEDEPNVN